MSETRQIINVPVFQPPNIFKFCDISFEKPLVSDNIKLVYMNEIGIIMSNNNNYDYIGTCALATCIALIGQCNQTGITLVAHLSDCTDVTKSIYLLNNILSTPSRVDVTLNIWLIGGFLGYSEPLFESIIASLHNIATFSFNIREISVMKSFVCKSVAINIKTGEIHDYVYYYKDVTDLSFRYKLPIDIDKYAEADDTDMSQFEIHYQCDIP